MIDAIIGRELDSILVVKYTLVKLVALYILLNVSVITLKKKFAYIWREKAFCVLLYDCSITSNICIK